MNRMTELVHSLEADNLTESRVELQGELDELVCFAYGLSTSLRSYVQLQSSELDVA